MAEKKHTIEDVLAQYAQTEEGAAHLSEQGQMMETNQKQAPKAVNTHIQDTVESEPEKPVTKSAAQGLKEQYEEAKNRPTMREAHIQREAEIKQELRDNSLGFIEIPMNALPTGGVFYPEGTRIHVRSASGGDIRHWSMTDETDVSAIDDALSYIIERCMRISFPNGQANWKDLKEIDRFYIILAIRDFTFPDGNNDLRIKTSEHQEITVHKDDVSFIDLGDKIMKYYNIEKRCFTFPTKNQAIGHVNIYMPSVGVTQWLKSYIQKKQQRQEQYDQDFITIAPMLISDFRKLNDNTYADLIKQTMNWGPYEWSLVSKVKGIIQNSITPKLKYIDESGAEQETPLNFQGGIKAIFNINVDEELDL